MNPHLQSVLAINVPGQVSTELAALFGFKFQQYTEVRCFTEAVRCSQRLNFSLGICDWEWCQAIQTEPSQRQSFHALLAVAIPLVFIATGQTVAVKFGEYQGHQFYSLRRSDCPVLLPVIAELAQQLAHDQRGQLQSRNGDAILAPSSAVKASEIRRPHVPVPIVVDPAMANSSVHVLT